MSKWLVFTILLTSGMACAQPPTTQMTKPVASVSTKDVLGKYFEALQHGGQWDSFLSDTVKFTSFTSPVKEVSGKAAYLQATKRFYSSIVSCELRNLIVEGDKACALTRYELQSPVGGRFMSDVAEVFFVRGGKIESFEIYFDTAPFPK